jgi:hypothetical protein
MVWLHHAMQIEDCARPNDLGQVTMKPCISIFHLYAINSGDTYNRNQAEDRKQEFSLVAFHHHVPSVLT